MAKKKTNTWECNKKSMTLMKAHLWGLRGY